MECHDEGNPFLSVQAIQSLDEIFGKFKDLESFNLDEPTLVRLFKGLKKEGIDFGESIRVDEAIRSIKRRWEEMKNN